MPSITSLISRLSNDYATVAFEQSDAFHWSPNLNVVYYNPSHPLPAAYTLHELSHAILRHDTYRKDVELLKIEREAWNYAARYLSVKYDTKITDNMIEDALDTYREWLHKRSLCPDCASTGLQRDQNNYQCLNCNQKWRVNQAKICALRRYKI